MKGPTFDVTGATRLHRGASGLTEGLGLIGLATSLTTTVQIHIDHKVRA